MSFEWDLHPINSSEMVGMEVKPANQQASTSLSYTGAFATATTANSVWNSESWTTVNTEWSLWEPTQEDNVSSFPSEDNQTSPTIASSSPTVVISFATWLGLITILVLLFTALGNTLVCIAISREKRLQNMTNYFLMSLAVTDFMVALLVMPFGILVIIKGFFPLSPIYCVVWITLDVLFCTCSILHLCTLSVDRYLSLRYPIKYGRNKTKRRVVLKICLVWMTSVAMSVPLSLMYSSDSERVIKDGVCAIQDPLYMTIGSIVSFYIPLCIMLVTHALTLQLLKEAEKTKTFSIINSYCNRNYSTASAATMANVPLVIGRAGSNVSACAGPDTPNLGRQSSYNWKRLVTKTYSNVSNSTDVESSDTHSNMEMQRLTTPEDTPLRRSFNKGVKIKETKMAADENASRSQLHTPLHLDSKVEADPKKADGDDSSSIEEMWMEVTLETQKRMHSITTQPDHVSTSLFCGNRSKVLCCGCGSDDERLKYRSKSESIEINHGADQTRTRSSWSDPLSPPIVSQINEETKFSELSTPMRISLSRATSIKKATSRQGRFIQSERKATKVLGIIFFTFVILWTPFFSLNIVTGLCPTCAENVSPSFSYFVLWLGYVSSTVNPVFYTIFNPTFRQAFVSILRYPCRQYQ